MAMVCIITYIDVEVDGWGPGAISVLSKIVERLRRLLAPRGLPRPRPRPRFDTVLLKT